MNNPAMTDPYPCSLAEVDLSASCETHGHVFGLITGSVRPCKRHGCQWVDALDPDEFTDPFGGLYDWEDPDREQLGYYGPDAYVLKVK